jgi:hypothetical protein
VIEGFYMQSVKFGRGEKEKRRRGDYKSSPLLPLPLFSSSKKVEEKC